MQCNICGKYQFCNRHKKEPQNLIVKTFNGVKQPALFTM